MILEAATDRCAASPSGENAAAQMRRDKAESVTTARTREHLGRVLRGSVGSVDRRCLCSEPSNDSGRALWAAFDRWAWDNRQAG